MSVFDRLTASIGQDSKDPLPPSQPAGIPGQPSVLVVDHPLHFANVRTIEPSLSRNEEASAEVQDFLDDSSLSFQPENVDEAVLICVPEGVDPPEIDRAEISQELLTLSDIEQRIEIQVGQVEKSVPDLVDEIVGRVHRMVEEHREEQTRPQSQEGSQSQSSQSADQKDGIQERVLDSKVAEIIEEEKVNQTPTVASTRVDGGNRAFVAFIIFFLITGTSYLTRRLILTKLSLAHPLTIGMPHSPQRLLVDDLGANFNEDGKTKGLVVDYVFTTNFTEDGTADRSFYDKVDQVSFVEVMEDGQEPLPSFTVSTAVIALPPSRLYVDPAYAWFFHFSDAFRFFSCGLATSIALVGVVLKLKSESLDNSGLAAVFQSHCENAVHSSDKSGCRCTKTLTDFENLMGFHKSFQPCGKGRTTGSLGDGKYPKNYNKLTMDELKIMIDGLDPTYAGPKQMYMLSKPDRVAKLYNYYDKVLGSFTKYQLISLLEIKHVAFNKSSTKQELVAVALKAGF